ncbi:MAG TPA: cytochrome c oxidase subunit 3 [Candidatus Deferrimicrobiaceae bacterium]|jgi:cytochrome c oxidase subunit 3
MHELGGAEAAHTAGGPETARLGIWLFLATEVLLFGGLFTAYTVFRMQDPALFHAGSLKLNRMLGAANTVVLICSSLTVALGLAAIREGKIRMLKVFLGLTLLLGAGFLGIKAIEYSEHFARREFPGTDLFFSLYFVMTALHAFHIAAGLAVFSGLLWLAAKGKFDAGYHTPVEVAGLYWHFVDVVWIYLFPLLYLIG